MQLVRSLDILQPDFQWQYQLRHERDITAQVEAVRSLERYPTPGKDAYSRIHTVILSDRTLKEWALSSFA